MMKRLSVAISLILSLLMCSGAIEDYNQLISQTIRACRSPDLFLQDDFTNEVVRFRNGHTGNLERCTADLSLVLALTHRRDNLDGAPGDVMCFSNCVNLLTNIVYNVDISSHSWLHSAAAFAYAELLNEDRQKSKSFCLSTNELNSLVRMAPDMTVTNFWDAMISYSGCSGASLCDAFKMNAALILADEGRWSEVVAYTNQLSVPLIMLFREDVK